MSSYLFKVKTNDETRAGTNSDVYVKLYGEFGESEQIRIQKYIKGDGLERGHTDEFKVPFSKMGGNIGMIYKITVRSDCQGAFSGWMLGHIEVTNKANDGYNKNTSKFVFDEWFLDTKTRTREYDFIKENKCVYKSVIEDFSIQPLSVGSKTTYKNDKTIKVRSEFTHRKVVTKESTTSFSADLSASISYGSAKLKAKSLKPAKAASGSINLGFSHSTSKSEVDEAVRVQEKEVTLRETFEITNDTERTKQYNVIYKIKRISAIVEFGSVVGEFDVISEIVFAGVQDVETRKFVIASREFATETTEQKELHKETV